MAKDIICGGYNWIYWVVFIAVFAIIAAWIIIPLRRIEHTVSADTHNPDDPFVFKKRAREECRSGELYNASLKMCTPRFNTPFAFESSIMDIHTSICTSPLQAICGKWLSQRGGAVNETRAFSFAHHVLDYEISQPQGLAQVFLQGCINMDSDNGKEHEIQMRHHIEALTGTIETYGDVVASLHKMVTLGYVEEAPLYFSYNASGITIQRLGVNRFVNVSTPLITAVLTANAHLTGYTTLFMINRVDRIKKVINAIDSSQQQNTSFDTSYEYLLPWRTPYPNPRGWSLFLGKSNIAYEQPIKIINAPYVWWLVSQGVKDLDYADWRAFFEFCVLWRSYRYRHPAKPDCVALTRHSIPGIVTEALNATDAEHMARLMAQRILDHYKSIAPASLARKVNDMRIRMPDEVHPVEEFEARLSPDRFDHNIALVLRKYPIAKAIGLYSHEPVQYNEELNTLDVTIALLQFPFYHANYDWPSRWAIMGSLIARALSMSADANAIDSNGKCIETAFGTPPGSQRTQSPFHQYLAFELTYNAALPYLTAQVDRQHFFMAFTQFWCNHGFDMDKLLQQRVEFRLAFTCGQLQSSDTPIACQPFRSSN